MKNYRNSLIQLAKREKLRKRLAIQRNSSSFIETYGLKKIVLNQNSSLLWDGKFIESIVEKQNNIEKDRNITSARWLKEVVKENSTITNIACGDGKFESLLGIISKKITYLGIDYARETIKRNKLRFPHFDFRVGDVTKFHSQKQQDVICAFEIFEHISENKILPLLKSINSNLKHNAYLLVAVPLNEPLLEMYPENPNCHVRLYSRETILYELEISGFEIIKWSEFYAFSSLYKLKKLLAKYILKNRWSPNDILILARKK